MSQYTQNLSIFRRPIEMPGGYSFRQDITLKRIDLYYNSKYETGEFDSKGYRKLFFNIVKPSCDIAQKFIDLDTKDVVLIPEHPDNYYTLWLMQRDLLRWMKEKNFGLLLNEISYAYPKYGTVVVKKSGDTVGLLNLQNLRLDPTAKSLKDSPFVYELH